MDLQDVLLVFNQTDAALREQIRASIYPIFKDLRNDKELSFAFITELGSPSLSTFDGYQLFVNCSADKTFNPLQKSCIKIDTDNACGKIQQALGFCHLEIEGRSVVFDTFGSSAAFSFGQSALKAMKAVKEMEYVDNFAPFVRAVSSSAFAETQFLKQLIFDDDSVTFLSKNGPKLKLYFEDPSLKPVEKKPQFTILGNSRFPIAQQFLELFRVSVAQADDLSWEQFNSLKKVITAIVKMASQNAESMFGEIPDAQLRNRMYCKLLNELRQLESDCNVLKFKDLLHNALEEYSPSVDPLPKRTKAFSEQLMDLEANEFRVLVPFQNTKVQRPVKAQDGSDLIDMIWDRVVIDKQLEGKKYWEYLS